MAQTTTKHVSFNLELPDEKESLAWALEKTSFSGYVKNLILLDRKRQPRNEGQQPVIKSNSRPLINTPR